MLRLEIVHSRRQQAGIEGGRLHPTNQDLGTAQRLLGGHARQPQGGIPRTVADVVGVSAFDTLQIVIAYQIREEAYQQILVVAADVDQAPLPQKLQHKAHRVQRPLAPIQQVAADDEPTGAGLTEKAAVLQRGHHKVEVAVGVGYDVVFHGILLS